MNRNKKYFAAFAGYSVINFGTFLLSVFTLSRPYANLWNVAFMIWMIIFVVINLIATLYYWRIRGDVK